MDRGLWRWHAYATVRNLLVSSGGNFHLFKTSDGGQHWDAGHKIGSVTQSGPLEVDKTKRSVTISGTTKDAILLYQLYYSAGTLKVFRITTSMMAQISSLTI